MTHGVIRLLVGERGFGFVSNDSGQDIFFHHTELEGIKFKRLKKGQHVNYKVGLGDKGLVAREVRPCKNPE